MEIIACDVQRRHLGGAHLDALLVGPRVERALDLQSGAPAGGPHLGRRAQAPTPFVELAADGLPAILNGVFIDHATDLRLFAEIRNPGEASHTVARPRIAIQLLFGLSLASESLTRFGRANSVDVYWSGVHFISHRRRVPPQPWIGPSGSVEP
jgi:hypothetical protein